MDTIYTEGELMTLHNDFHHAAYHKVLSFDTTSVSPDVQLPARILQLRAQIATGQAKEVIASVSREADSNPDLAAVKVLALYVSGSAADALAEAEALASSSPDNTTVQVLAGTVLQGSGKSEEALSLLSKHQGSLEAVALTTQIHLASNRNDLALKEVAAAKKWAQDSLLINIAESWVGLRLGGDRYQQAFYEFEEMPVAQAIAETHLGRLPEAETTLRLNTEDKQAENSPTEEMQTHALANLAVVQTLAGKNGEVENLLKDLQRKMPSHPLLEDLSEKGNLFNEAAKKYTPRAAVS